MLPRISDLAASPMIGGSPWSSSEAMYPTITPVRRVYVEPVAEEFDLEASGLLDGLEGKARAERAELIPWLLEHGVTVEQIRGAYTPALLVSRRILGDDGTYVSARETSEKTGIDL